MFALYVVLETANIACIVISFLVLKLFYSLVLAAKVAALETTKCRFCVRVCVLSSIPVHILCIDVLENKQLYNKLVFISKSPDAQGKFRPR